MVGHSLREEVVVDLLLGEEVVEEPYLDYSLTAVEVEVHFLLDSTWMVAAEVVHHFFPGEEVEDLVSLKVVP